MDIVYITQYANDFGLCQCMDDVMPGIMYGRHLTLESAKEEAEKRWSNQQALYWEALSPDELAYAEGWQLILAKGAPFQVLLALRGVQWPSKELRQLHS